MCFCEDVAASGGYWLACAGKEIYSDVNSIIGSIGVISASFGFSELISRYGIERRVYTAGEEKSMLDPFQPEKASDVKRLKAIQKAIFENFKSFVSERRGEKIKGKKIFNLECEDGTLLAKNLIWAGGEFQYPRLDGFVGSELCRHTSTVSNYSNFDGDNIIVIGGYESGVDAAYHLAKSGKKVVVFDKDNPSSVFNCVLNARNNALIVRTSFTREAWLAINQTYREVLDLSLIHI